MCHHVESPTANTLFHMLGIRKAFIIVFELSDTNKSVSSLLMARRLDISRQTAWLFMYKVRIAMKNSDSQPKTGLVFIDEFIYVGKEDLKQSRSNKSKNKKIVLAVGIDENRGVKRANF